MSTEHTITITITTDDDNEITNLGLETAPGSNMLHAPAALMVMTEKLIAANAGKLQQNGYCGSVEEARARLTAAAAQLAAKLTDRTESDHVEFVRPTTEEATDGR